MANYDFTGLDKIKGPQYNFDGLDKIGAPAQPQEEGALGGLKAAALGAADYNTLGTASEIYGGLAAGANKIKDAVTGDNSGDLSDLYRKYQQQAAGAMKESEAAHPYIYHGAGIGSSLLTGNAALDLLGASKLGAVGAGAAIGGITGAAKSEHNLDSLEGAEGIASDAAKGAAFGGVTGGVIHGAGKAVAKLGELSGADEWGRWLANKVKSNPTVKSRLIQPAEEGFNSTQLGVEDAADKLAGADYTSGEELKKAGLTNLNAAVGTEQGGKIDDVARELGERLNTVVTDADKTPMRMTLDPLTTAIQRIKDEATRRNISLDSPAVQDAIEELQGVYYKTVPESIPNAQVNKTTETYVADPATGAMELAKEKRMGRVRQDVTPDELAAAETTDLPRSASKTLDAAGNPLTATKDIFNQSRTVNRPGEARGAILPSEFKAARDEVSNIKERFLDNDETKSWMKPILIDLDNNMRGELSKIPGYDQAAEHFSTYLNNVPETILSGTLSPEDAGKSYSDLSRKGVGRGMLVKNISGAVENTFPGGPVSNAATSLDNIQDGLSKFQNYENLRAQQSVLTGDKFEPVFNKIADSPEAFVNNIKDNSLRYNAAQRATSPGGVRGGFSTTGLLGGAARAIPLAANQGGKVAGVAVNMGKAMVGASDEVLSNVSQTLKSTPGLGHLGAALDKAIHNKSDFLKNAAIYSILQNPNARQSIGF